MLLIGEDPRKHIHEYSQQFLRAFLQQLKTAHGTKPVHINHFYQEYIQDKEHIHMNATKWKSLTEFAKYLGQEGICRVEETEKGLHVAWIDNSPEALKRQAAIQKQERMERNDEEWEQRMIREQIRRAQEQAQAQPQPVGQKEPEAKPREFERKEGEKVKFSFGSKQKPPKPPTPPGSDDRSSSEGAEKEAGKTGDKPENALEDNKAAGEPPKKKQPMKMSLGSSAAPAPKQKPRSMAALFGARKGGGQKRTAEEEPKKMSEAERVMREDMERNQGGRFNGVGFGPKRVKLG